MFWDHAHTGQTSTNELVIAENSWENLLPIPLTGIHYYDNYPLYLDEYVTHSITRKCLDPLIWYDSDMSTWPHLAESITFLNDTHIRINCREGVIWEDDPDGLFTNEEFDAQDVYFTLFCWKNLSNSQYLFSWIDDIRIVDKVTIDIYAKSEDHPYSYYNPSRYYSTLAVPIIPEHYLNQSQLSDGITPNHTHISWENFAKHCFGTGLFQIDDFNEGQETILVVKPNSWWLDNEIINDTNLEWGRRFGDFSNKIEQLRIRHIPDTVSGKSCIQARWKEFERGKLDISPHHKVKYEEFILDSDFEVQSFMTWQYDYFTYNMRPDKLLGNRELCPNDSSMTIGFALRKAISYAMNRVEMNDIIHGGNYRINDYPFFERQGVWRNPNIISYNHDLEKAWEYMEKAGFTNPIPTVDSGVNFMFMLTISFIAVIVVYELRKRRVKKNEK
jgi:ABC-type transport system substrate-binding protein